jgi:hypothetical protein
MVKISESGQISSQQCGATHNSDGSDAVSTKVPRNPWVGASVIFACSAVFSPRSNSILLVQSDSSHENLGTLRHYGQSHVSGLANPSCSLWFTGTEGGKSLSLHLISLKQHNERLEQHIWSNIEAEMRKGKNVWVLHPDLLLFFSGMSQQAAWTVCQALF